MARGSRDNDHYDDDHDTDAESEKDLIPPRKSGVRKRLSEAFIPENDSFTSDSGRVPLKSVNINDDAAEKRRRRKSTKIHGVEAPVASPSSDPNDQGDTSRSNRQKQQLNTIAPPVIKVPLDVMSSNFEEWMKMATDNKINAANSWNFALIDYFHDMSLLRNDDDNSINFQRASCTLDGCVKIWTSRVDSVGSETAKLASNLASGRSDDAEESGQEDTEEDPTQPKKKKHRSAATLVKDPSQLRIKKLELEFSVDPLFKKTCADFDEGGAQGLLMNHLSLGVGNDGGLRVVFDAGDSVSKGEDDEDVDEPEDFIDLSYLRKEFLPDLNALEYKEICHSLKDFSFSKKTFSSADTTFYKDNPQADFDDDDEEFGPADSLDMDIDNSEQAIEDFFQGDEAPADAYADESFDGDNFGGDDFGGGDEHSNDSYGVPADHDGSSTGTYASFDPRQASNDHNLVLAMGGNVDATMESFDKTFNTNWAGPEHWKLRRLFKKPVEVDPTKGPKPRREKKEAFKIDFLTPPDPNMDQEDMKKELFAPAARGAGINLAGTSSASRKSKKKGKENEKRDDHRLPDDMHFTSKQLVSLFLKPKFSLKMRGRRFDNNEESGEVDERYWAQAAADQAAGRGRINDDQTENGGAVPFNTQFFNEDDDDDVPVFGFDDAFEADGMGLPAEGEDLLAATQGQTRRVKPAFVNYTKRAKRVDVRKLKENIWKGLDIVVSHGEADDGMDVDEVASTDPAEAREFSSVLSGLQTSYPQDKLQELSTSFCFICLLHLANEQGLKIENGENSTTSVEDTEGVGNIWNLKVFRDPTATLSA
ncbi:barren [Guyanagaster necrorhizus]|uniref:Condensin complex subunit 2 n=1 Tax=Guyanagaster necrorhizus TaxID=856835 RepID=A0A9P7VMX2_9AGAR|nr:barren [Guyanagaster necrorhizus MCA 3950]KAG7443664.1 barren [Guyanagaster necrorhizus MCA 3950]